MEEMNTNNPIAKKKLTKEELMAGKCDPNEGQDNSDPRQKSPDDLLLKLLAKKKEQPQSNPVAVQRASAQKGSAQQQDNLPRAEVIPAQNLGDIQSNKWLALKEMYDRDMTRWKEYEQNVVHWREKVLQIVQRLQNELAAAKGLKDEVDALKSVIKAKDEEIAKTKKTLAHYLNQGK
jgi:hypothetical protein